ncbi:MAG: hypothetical protein QM820_59675 [Minicystis sp.]
MSWKLAYAIVAAPVLSVCSAGVAHAYAVYGDIGNIYEAEGRERGELGAPTSDEQPFGTSGDRMNYFEHGYILWWRANRETLVHVYDRRFTYRIPVINFEGPDPVGGHDVTLTITSNGVYNFSGRFHSAAAIFNPIPESTHITVAIRSPNGIAYTFANHGSVSAFSRNHEWNESGQNGALASGWSDLQHGGVRFAWQASTRIPISDIFDWVFKAFGAVTTVLSVIG